MRHCVGSYVDEITWNNCYFYHVEKGVESIATVQLVRGGTKPKLGQVRGPCNAAVDKKITQVLRKWMRLVKELPALKEVRQTDFSCLPLAQNADDLDAEIPF